MKIYICKGRNIRNKDGEQLLFKALESHTGGRYTGGTVQRSKLGKPSFSDVPLHFSISHTEDLWFSVFFPEEVGLDFQIERKVKYEKISQRFFSPEEAEYLKHEDSGEFFRLWTRKEAFCKYTGMGIYGGDMKKYSVLEPVVEYIFEDGNSERIALVDLHLDLQILKECGQPGQELVRGLKGRKIYGALAVSERAYEHLGEKLGELDYVLLEDEKDLEAMEKEGQEAYEEALNLLDFGDKTRGELEKKLKEKGFSREAVASAIGMTEELGFVSDREYAERYVSRESGKVRGRNKIRMDLQKKHVDSSIIEDALSDQGYSRDKEREAALALGEKVLEASGGRTLFGAGGEDFAEELQEDSAEARSAYEKRQQQYKEIQKLKGKVSRKLQSRGFGPEVIYYVLEKLFRR